MKNHLLIFFLFGVLFTGVYAQKADQQSYVFTINNNRIAPQPNFQEAKKMLKAQRAKTTDQVEYLILQFSQIPTKEERAALSKEGVTLLNYLQGNAFYAAVSQKFYNISRASAKNIRALVPILPSYKVDHDLINGETPKYARGDRGKVKIVITYFKGADVLKVRGDLSSATKSGFSIDEQFRLIQTEASRDEITALAKLGWIQNIEMIAPPAELNNKEGVNLHRSNVLNSKIRGLGYGLTGKGVTLGLWDADVENHRDFGKRIKVREFEMHNTDHGTHTCGTIGSAGLLDPSTRGMAPEINIVSWNFNTQSNGLVNFQEREKSITEDGIELTSNSFGMRVTTCPNPFSYNYTDANEDFLAYKYPTFLYVYSAGNDQTSCSGGFNTTSKNLKNSLIVAAVDRQSEMSTFSSFGPSKDGRLIPNISGDGVDVYSTFFNNSYGYMDGTSMATPGVAGTMALIYQRYKETHGNQKPTSALLRALACNTAKDLGNAGPDYKFGYGSINGLRAVQVLENSTYVNASVEQGKSYTKQISVPAGAVALKVMLSWTDNYGMPGTSKAITNNIDLKVTNESATYLPWVLDPQNPNKPAVRGIDDLNNLEQVTINNPQSGTYTIKIEGTEIPDGVQDFAIVYDVVMPYITLTFPIGGESLVPESEVMIHWDSEGYTGKFMLEYSEDGGITYNTIASNISSNQRSYLWKVPNTFNTAKGKIRVSFGTRFSETKGVFNIMPTPETLKIDEVSCGGSSTTITWDAISNAKYEVLKLNGEIYERLAEVNTNRYNIAELLPGNDNYFAVRAIDLTTGAISERSLAVSANPATIINKLPIKEDFESQKASNFTFSSNNGLSSVKYVNTTQQYGMRLEGPASAITPAWNASSVTAEECFTNNAAYITRANICNIDASDFAGKQMALKFDYRQKFRTVAGTSYFRVKVNGIPATSIDGVQIFGAANTTSYQTVYYDLTPFAGNSSLNIEFEAVCKTSYTTYINSSGNYDFSNDNYDEGDFVNIDNVELYEPPKDIALSDLVVSNSGTNPETITITIKNLSGTSISSIPVSYQIENSAPVNEIISGPVTPFTEMTYAFIQKADFSAEGSYEIKAEVKLPGDLVTDNDTKTIFKNVDLSLKMTNGTSTITGCGLILTDAGGKFEDYPVSVTSTRKITPDAAGKNVRITFSEFALEEDYDFLYIYDGPSTSSPQLAKLDGNILPSSFTSSAPNGELTLKFSSDAAVNDKGFVATIDCVDKPNVDLAVTAIDNPLQAAVIREIDEEVSFTIKNYGKQDINSYDVYYKINDNAPVKETFTESLTSGASKLLSFTTTADLSAPATYKLKVWVQNPDDAFNNNDTATISVTSLPSTLDVGISAISTIVPRRNASSSISATIQNYGTLPASNINIAYSINGGAEVVQSVTGPIAPGATVLVTFATNADLSAFNTYDIDVYTKLVNDNASENDKKSVQIVRDVDASTNVVSSYNTGNAIVTGSLSNRFSLTNNFTVEFWMKSSKNPKYGTMFSKGFSIIHHSEYYPAAYNTNCLLLSIGGQLFMTPNNSIKNDEWQHIALTSASDGTIKLYINGAEQALSNNAKAIQSSNLSTPVRIGSNSTYSQPYYGSIDELRIWNSARDQATIAANMMTDYAPNTSGMYAYYKFKEGNGAYVYDYSSNDNTCVALNSDFSGVGENKFWNTPGNLLRNVSLVDEKIPVEFDESTKTYKGIMDENASLNAIVSKFSAVQLSVVKVGNTIQTSGVTSNNFSTNPTLDYTVEGTGFNAGISQTFHLNVAKDQSSACTLNAFSFEATLNNLDADIVLEKNGSTFYKKATNSIVSSLRATFDISPKAKLIINDEEQTNPQNTAIDYSHPQLVKVVSENGRFANSYIIQFDTRSNLAELRSFTMPDYQVGTTDINNTNHTVSLWVKKNTNLNQLTPTFDLSPKASLFIGSICQKSGITPNNYSSAVQYSVVSEDEENTTDWMISMQVDNIQPTISLKGASNMTVALGSPFTDPGATATDNVDGDISQQIAANGTVNTSVLGTYTITYNVSDASGNAAQTITRTVAVTDQTAPVIALIGSSELTIPYGTSWVDPGITAIDNSDGDISTNVAINGSVNAFALGTYILTYSVSDLAGNAAVSVTRTVNVVKATATVIISGTTQTYNGTGKAVTVTTIPDGLPVEVKYNGNIETPVNAGSYDVVVSVTDANYAGTQSQTLVIEKAQATIEISNTTQKYDGLPKPVTVSTNPAGLNTTVTYNASNTVPSNEGTYAVVATIIDDNYQGSLEVSLTIEKNTGISSNKENDINIYAYASDVFVKIPLLEEKADLIIYNTLGKAVYQSNTIMEGVNKIKLNVSPGTYVIKLKIGDKVYSQKVTIL